MYIMKTAFKALSVMLLLGVCSCEQTEMKELPSVTQANLNEEVITTEGMAIDLVKNFRQSLSNSSAGERHGKTKSSDFFLDNITVDECEKTTYHFPLEDIVVKSRSLQVPDSTNVDLYLVKFHTEDGIPGYSIATSDERINKVYAYSRGQISDTAAIYPLACIIKSIPSVLKNDLIKYYQDTLAVVQSRGSAPTTFGPLVTTHWDQHYPYNSQCLKYSEPFPFPIGDNGRAPAGCATIAAAQVVAYYRRFTSNIFNNGTRFVYNFNALLSSSRIDASNSALVFEVGQFCKEIGEGIGVKWTKDAGDLTDPTKISDYLSIQQGYKTVAEDDENVDINRMANNIMNGNPHITAGMRKSPRTGHVWIWDGVQLNPTRTEVTMVHCNWGAGHTDGVNSDTWFTPATMEQPDPNKQPYFDDNVQIYITNYSYNPGGIF